MASIQTDTSTTRKKRARKSSTHIDMTPMVDLAFLLLTFFILVSTFTRESAIEITYPVDGPPQKINNAMTLIPIENDRLLYYRGEFNTDSGYSETNYKKIRHMLMELNETARVQVDELRLTFYKQNPNIDFTKDSVYRAQLSAIYKLSTSLKCVIKPYINSKYKNVIDLVDEMHICDIGSYAISDKFSEEENKLLTRFYPEKNE